jgi:hypothetical protein
LLPSVAVPERGLSRRYGSEVSLERWAGEGLRDKLLDVREPVEVRAWRKLLDVILKRFKLSGSGETPIYSTDRSRVHHLMQEYLLGPIAAFIRCIICEHYDVTV